MGGRAEVMGGEMEDAALVRLARDGDRPAFAKLVERHWDLFLALCRRTLGDDDLAHDAAQEAVLHALLSLDRLRRAASFGPWLAGIGLNVCRGWLRYRPRDAWSWEALQGGTVTREPIDWQPGPEATAEAADLSARVLRAVAGLPQGQRSAVLLFYLGGLTYAETAAELGIEISALKTRLHKGRVSLRQELLSLWEEESMTVSSTPPTGTQAIEMRVVDVRRTRVTEDRPPRNAILLEEIGGTRSLIFGVGRFEGDTIAMLLEKVESTRPLPHAFMVNVLKAAGGELKEVRITRLAGETFYAVAVIQGANGPQEADARPSDAVSLALLTGAPIYVATDVLATVESGAPPFNSPVTDRLSRLHETSIGAAEIVAAIRDERANWRTGGLTLSVDTPPAPDPGPGSPTR